MTITPPEMPPMAPRPPEARRLADILASEESHRQLAAYFRRLALHDQLTGLNNRHATLEYTQSIFQAVQGLGHELPPDDGFLIIACDVDKFKSINDTKGHQAGDAVLEGLGQHMQEQITANLMRTVRGRDNRTQGQYQRYNDAWGLYEDFVARLGGEEFLMILPTRRLDKHLLLGIVRRIYGQVCGPYDLGNGECWPVSISMGLHFLPLQEILVFASGLLQREPNQKQRDKMLSEFLFHAADEASYRAKETGRARAFLSGDAEPLYVYDGPVSEAVLASRVGLA